MGQKVHPYVLRLGFGKDWQSKWFAGKRRDMANFLEEDICVRDFVKKSYPMGSIAAVIIERVSSELIRLRVRTSRPGVIIGRHGQDIERVKKALGRMTKREIIIDVEEVLEPALEAQLVSELIGFQMLKRVNYRRAMKKALQQANALGCEGVKIRCSGRLGGVEIARSEVYKYGKIPLQTFKADIDYGYSVAKTTYGTIGVKTWIYKGEKLPGSYLVKQQPEQENTDKE